MSGKEPRPFVSLMHVPRRLAENSGDCPAHLLPNTNPLQGLLCPQFERTHKQERSRDLQTTLLKTALSMRNDFLLRVGVSFPGSCHQLSTQRFITLHFKMYFKPLSVTGPMPATSMCMSPHAKQFLPEVCSIYPWTFNKYGN